MNSPRQIFQTESRLRWKAFQWISRIILFLLALTIPVVWIAVALHIDPQLPSLSLKNFSKSAEIIPKGLTSREVKKYKGFSAFIKKECIKYYLITQISSNSSIIYLTTCSNTNCRELILILKN